MISPRSSALESFTRSTKTAALQNKMLKLASARVETNLSSSSTLLKGLRLSANTTRISRKPGARTKRGISQVEEEATSNHIFKHKLFVVEFSFSTPYQRKTAIKEDIKRNGGTVSHVVKKEVDAVIVYDETCTDSIKCKRAVELSIPVVSLSYITDCIARGACVDYDDYKVCGLKRVDQLESGKISGTAQKKPTRASLLSSVDWRGFPSHTDPRHVGYIDHPEDYRVPKWSFLTTKDNGLCVLEIHVVQTDGNKNQYRVVTLRYTNMTSSSFAVDLRETEGPYQAELLFASLHSYYVTNLRYTKLDYVPFQKGSPKLVQSLFSWAQSNAMISDNVKQLVDGIWREAVGEIEKSLSVPVNNLSKGVVEQAEGILIEIKENIKAGNDNSVLRRDFYNTLPFKPECRLPLDTLKSISKQFNMIQLLYDLLSVGEMADWNLQATTQTKLKSLNCHIADSDLDHKPEVLQQIENSGEGIVVSDVFTVARPTEHLVKDGKERKLLYHASNPENYLGILSRGLLLPKHVVNDFGGRRTDAGNLGHGVYFADDFGTSHEYSWCMSDNSRLMLLCEVVTGNSYSTTSKMPDLTEAPAGYDSVKAEAATDSVQSQFKSNEYCVYNTSQQALRYIIRYSTSEDRMNLSQQQEVSDDDENMEVVEEEQTTPEPVIDDISDRKLADVLPGLQMEGKDQVPIPLQALRVVAKIVDLAAEVTVIQEYFNYSTEAIETKFVFPLSEMAAVCGFEAFINDKHIIGEVKEKETAQKEYRKAVSEGHGAYLMVQDVERPDVFTVSVGNMPPQARVFIKITYVCELSVRDEKFLFELPTNIAPWNAKQALAETTQSTYEKVGLDNSKLKDVDCGMEISIQMPFDIREIHSPTHNVNIKKTETQAMVLMKEYQSLADGFSLSISLAEIHVPRMIIEKHSENPEAEQACMLTFYPEFDCVAQDNYESIIMLDLSNSMTSDDIISSKKIAIVLLVSLNKQSSFNLITFGSTYAELFDKSMPANKTNIKRAVSYIQTSPCRQGNTDLLTPLTNLSLLTDTCRHRNVIVISDGHMTHSRETLQAVSSMYGTIRLFTLAVSSNANKFLMRELARVGSGTTEYMNSSSKSKWHRQIKGIVEKAGQPLLSQVKVSWQEQNTDMPVPLQAPACIPSVFNGNRIVVYGFASNCFMATLKAVIDGREVSTVVYASPITASTGLIVHRLAARAVIQDWEHGCLSTDSVEHESLKKKQKHSIIEMSKEYSIITQFTSFVAVEKREPGEQLGTKTGPKMSNLLADLNADLLPYMKYEGTMEVFCNTLTGRRFPVTISKDTTGGFGEVASDDEEVHRMPTDELLSANEEIYDNGGFGEVASDDEEVHRMPTDELLSAIYEETYDNAIEGECYDDVVISSRGYDEEVEWEEDKDEFYAMRSEDRAMHAVPQMACMQVEDSSDLDGSEATDDLENEVENICATVKTGDMNIARARNFVPQSRMMEEDTLALDADLYEQEDVLGRIQRRPRLADERILAKPSPAIRHSTQGFRKKLLNLSQVAKGMNEKLVDRSEKLDQLTEKGAEEIVETGAVFVDRRMPKLERFEVDTLSMCAPSPPYSPTSTGIQEPLKSVHHAPSFFDSSQQAEPLRGTSSIASLPATGFTLVPPPADLMPKQLSAAPRSQKMRASSNLSLQETGLGFTLDEASFDSAPQAASFGSASQRASFRSAPQEASFGSAPQRANFGSAAQVAGFGSAPQRASVRSASQRASFGSAAQGAGFGSAPQRASFRSAAQRESFGSAAQVASFASAPQGSLFDSAPQGASFGSASQRASFGSAPQGASFDSAPQGASFGLAPQAISFGSTAQAESFGSASQEASFGSAPQGTSFGSTSHGSIFGSAPQAASFDSAPQGVSFGYGAIPAPTTAGFRGPPLSPPPGGYGGSQMESDARPAKPRSSEQPMMDGREPTFIKRKLKSSLSRVKVEPLKSSDIEMDQTVDSTQRLSTGTPFRAPKWSALLGDFSRSSDPPKPRERKRSRSRDRSSKGKEKTADRPRSPVQTKRTPGIYYRSKDNTVSLRIDYSSLTYLPWNTTLHLIEDGIMNPTRRLYQKTDTHYVLIKTMLQAIEKVDGFSYFSLEKVLISAGVLSLGKTAATEILCLFLWKISTFVKHVTHLIDTHPGSVDVQNVVSMLNSTEVPTTTPTHVIGWLKKYWSILSRLELGKCWSDVIINMMCDIEKHEMLLIEK